MNAASFNKPQTGNEIINSNGHKLHFRVEGHALPNAKALIIYVPGYSGHVNRPEMFKMTGCMNRNGVVVIAVDMQGHGYSEGERCLMLSHEDLIADVIQIVDAIMNPSTTEIITFCNNLGEIKRDYLPKLQKLPFFVMGSSMGGAISSMVAQRLYANRLAYPTFSGAILCAPALTFKTPHWLLVESLRYTVGTCTPTAEMPAFLNNVGNNSLTFKHAEALQMTEADTWGNEGALGWNKGMRWATALMFIEFGAAIRASMSSVAHPFLILHDPGDEICGIEGSRMLIQQSVTPDENKELIELPGYLHGLLANETEAVCERCVPWMQRVIANREREPAAALPGVAGDVVRDRI